MLKYNFFTLAIYIVLMSIIYIDLINYVNYAFNTHYTIINQFKTFSKQFYALYLIKNCLTTIFFSFTFFKL